MIATVIDYLQADVRRNPRKIALYDENKGSFTYEQIDYNAKKIASILMQKKVLTRPIVVFVDKSAFSIIAFLGIVYTGQPYVPIDGSMPVERLKKILDEIKPEMILAESRWFEKANGLGLYTVIELTEKLFEIDCEINDVLINERLSKVIDVDPLYIIYTSGSTGNPKGVVISHRSVIDFAEEASEAMYFSEEEVFMNQSPFYFDASVPDIYCMLRNLATLHIVSSQTLINPLKTLKYMDQNSITSIFGVPSNLVRVANSRCLEKVIPHSLKKIMFCGEVMPVKQFNIWKKYLPDATYVNYYGPTETTYACTYYIVNRKFSDTDVLPIGKPCKNASVLILDETNRLVRTGEVGELCVKGTCLSLGYYQNEAVTNEKYIQNPYNSGYRDILYKTGDLVRYNSYGELEYVSRKDFQIKYHGYRIELGEIEAAISSIDGVRLNCCIFSEEKEGIFAFYEADNEIEVEVELENKLQDYMIPQKCIRLSAIPLNNNGKIDRKELKRLLNNEQSR